MPTKGSRCTRYLTPLAASLLFCAVHLSSAEAATPATLQPPLPAKVSKGKHARHAHLARAKRQAQRRILRAPSAGRGAVEVGTASWYGPGFTGRRMASGRIYRPTELVAAHAWLPLGSKVRVKRLDNDRYVDVIIADRPGTRSRVIDLSEEAARQLGMLRSGVAQVALEPL